MKPLPFVLAVCCGVSLSYADPMSCSTDGYRAQPGLLATQAGNTLTLQWAGDRGQELRMRFALVQGTPTIQELALRRAGGTWGVLAMNAERRSACQSSSRSRGSRTR